MFKNLYGISSAILFTSPFGYLVKNVLQNRSLKLNHNLGTFRMRSSATFSSSASSVLNSLKRNKNLRLSERKLMFLRFFRFFHSIGLENALLLYEFTFLHGISRRSVFFYELQSYLLLHSNSSLYWWCTQRRLVSTYNDLSNLQWNRERSLW